MLRAHAIAAGTRVIGAGIGLAIAVATLFAAPQSAWAHPAPWSYVDLRIAGAAVEVRFTIHVYDLAHELSVVDAERLLVPSDLARHAEAATALLRSRFVLEVNGRVTAGEWSSPASSGEGDSVRLVAWFRAEEPVAHVSVVSSLFPYDPLHQTFVNVYEEGALQTQVILDAERTTYSHGTGANPGSLAIVRQFVPAGVHHILIGPDHLLFLVGLLLLGGTWRRLVVVVTAFTVAHSVTLSVAALGWVEPPASVIEPAIALSIVYVGIDNLLVRGGRDARTWIAFVFGLIHGFGFANVLREMALPRSALIWSLASFNVGVEIGQLAVVIVVAALLGAVRARNARLARQIGFAGSIVVITAGAFWFVQRVFSGGV